MRKNVSSKGQWWRKAGSCIGVVHGILPRRARVGGLSGQEAASKYVPEHTVSVLRSCLAFTASRGRADHHSEVPTTGRAELAYSETQQPCVACRRAKGASGMNSRNAAWAM